MAEFRVDSLDDGQDPEDGLTTLREAVAAANAAPGDDRILFDVGGTIALDPDLGELTVTDALSIEGGGVITLDGGGATRLIAITDAAAETRLAGLTLIGGNGAGTGTGGGAVLSAAALTLDTVTLGANRTLGDDAPGGAVSALGDLVLIDSTVRDNTTFGANSKGGGIAATGRVTMTGGEISANTTTGATASGGGLYAAGAIAIEDAAIRDNATAGVSASGGGVAGAGTVALTRATVAGNATYGAAANGGGVYAAGSLSLADSMVGGPTATAGNATHGANAVGGGLAGRGGVSVSGSTIEMNATKGAGANGGGLYAGGVLTVGALEERASLIAGNRTEGDDAQGGGVSARGDAVIADTTFSANATIGLRASGGALHGETTLALARSSLTGNRTEGAEAPGGALHARASAALSEVYMVANATRGDRAAGGAVSADSGLEIAASTIRDNSTLGDGSPGGALSAGGALRIERTTLSGNATEGEAAAGGALRAAGSLEIFDSTLDRNSTSGTGSSGGAVAVDGPAGLDAVTFLGNVTFGDAAGGGAISARGVLRLGFATLEENRTSGAGAGGGAIEAAGALTLLSSSLIANATAGSGAAGGAIDATGPAMLTQTTLVGNTTADASGGGIAASGGLTLINATLTGNSAGGPEGAGGGVFAAGRLALGNSILLGNAATAGGEIAVADAQAMAETLGPNILGGVAPETVFAVTAPFGAGTVAGVATRTGLVPTVALRSDGDNPALDAGDEALLSELASPRDLTGDGDRADRLSSDARGSAFQRIIDLAAAENGPGFAVDLGAVELGTLRRPPGAVADAAAATEGGPAITLDLTANDVAADEQTIRVAGLETTGLLGTATLLPDGRVSYDPGDAFDGLAAGEIVEDVFLYRLEDGGGDGDTGRVTVRVTGVNDAPAARDDSATVVVGNPATISVLENDADPDPGDALRILGLDLEGTLGSVTLGPDRETILYDPGAGFAGLATGQSATDTLRYTVADPDGATATATLSVTVFGTAPPPQPPSPQDDAARATSGAAIALDPLADNGAGPDTDVNGDALALVGVGRPANGVAGIGPDGAIIYRSAPGFVGTDSFSYTIEDATGRIASATVTVAVGAEPDPGGLTRAEAQRVALLFDAALDRGGQAAGVNFWIDRREAGASHREVAAEFLDNPEFTDRFGEVAGLDDATLVRRLFLNVLDREGRGPGIEHWTARVGAADFDRADLLIAFADSAENLFGASGIAGMFEAGEGVWAFG